ncbi:MAG: hypothetical protein JNK76_25825 [Planctomycetales bacterium]|nr:hypothetical protein [Planctomycetales bacterium]MBN8624242.1 hypothetical protein [Planctomycetota bacterium]
MGLYLCVFDEDEELGGVEVGTYSDFDAFRSTVIDQLEQGRSGAKYPTLILHSDCDGEWSAASCVTLKDELREIADNFQRLPPRIFAVEWQQQTAKLLGLKPLSLYDSFIDVDGEPLLERLQHLCDIAIRSERPILFQ